MKKKAITLMIVALMCLVLPMRNNHNGQAQAQSGFGLLGAMEERFSDIAPFTKWTTALARSKTDSPSVPVAFTQDLASDIPLERLATIINTRVNILPYIPDEVNWGQSDHWATPAEFWEKGGDCEDFAIAKYMTLRALGIPESRLRLLIVHDNIRNIPHAVIAVYTDTSGVLILDNQNEHVLTEKEAATAYRPIFALNTNAWWRYESGLSLILMVSAAGQ